jgi:hypothetical protein
MKDSDYLKKGIQFLPIRNLHKLVFEKNLKRIEKKKRL